MSQMIPGLGIDMGLPPAQSTNTHRKRSQTIESAPQEYTASLNQYNNQLRRQSQLPSTEQPIKSHRKTRSTSGQSESTASRSDASNSSSNSPQEDKRYVAQHPNRNRRLSAAVAAMMNQDWDSSSSSSVATPSDLYSSDASPDTEHSSTSQSSNMSSLKRNKTVRKQRSQPDLTIERIPQRSRPGTTAQSSYGPPRVLSNGMARSKSAIGIATLQNNDSGSESGASSLGRSRAILRSSSKGPPRGRHARSATWDPKSAAAAMADEEDGGLIPDGFGGYTTEEERSDIDHIEERENVIVRLQKAANRPLPQQPTHVSSEATSQLLGIKVGSFYGPDGSETARLDEDGRLSTIGSDYSHSAPRSIISMSTAPSQRSRAQSQSGPRPRFMASPATNAGTDSGSEDSRSIKSGMQAAQSSTANVHTIVPMHSSKFFRGLEGAEKGEAMVTLVNNTFSTGDEILPARMQATHQDTFHSSARPQQPFSTSERYVADANHNRRQSAPAISSQHNATALNRSMTDAMARNNVTQLERQNTLISTSAGPARRSKELNRLLASNGRKFNSSESAENIPKASTDPLALMPSTSRNSTISIADMPPAMLEQGRSGKNRVDVDLVLESDLVVEGGYLRGRLEIKVRKNSDRNGPLMLTQPKVRVVGFEELLNDDTRHIFYHHATVIDGSPTIGSQSSQPYILHGTPTLSPQADNRHPLPCFVSPADSEGYCIAKEGVHSVPFAMELPVGKGAKGSYRGKHAIVRYIVIGSVKLKSADGSNRSIAHFYRHVELYPYLNPAVVLSSSPRPIQASASKGLFLGGNGKVHLSASLHRSTWIAGQRVYLNLRIDNETSKKVKSLTLALVRTVTLFRPRPELDVSNASGAAYLDQDACNTSTSRKRISEEVLEMGQKGTKGVVTAKGWWTGVEAGEIVEISHSMKLPVDALTITRGRHVEVVYSIKASVNSSLSSDVSVELPLRVVNFVSLDPPPLKSSCTKVTRHWTRENHQRNAMSESEAPKIEKMKYLEASRSPLGLSSGLGLETANQMQYALQPEPGVNESRLQVPGGDKKLQHQKSLDFINHAIRSATARKTRSNEPSPMGLGIELDNNRTPPAVGNHHGSSALSCSGASIVSSVVESIDPSCDPYIHTDQYLPPALVYQRGGNDLYQHPVNIPIIGGSMNDVGDDTVDELGYGNQTLNLNEESVDEVDFVIGSAHLDGGESSPAFQQRQEFGTDEYVDSFEDNEGDLSTSTITSQRGIREEDEYDEEEEWLEEQRRRGADNRDALLAPTVDLEDETTPLAHSPPKFASNVAPARLASQSKSIPRMQIHIEDSEDDYSSSVSSFSRRSVVRTESDTESRLGRSSTIIKGPSGSMSRPVSPSKQAASPTKSALKSQKSFASISSQSSKRPTTLKAKVLYSQIPKAIPAPRGLAFSSSSKGPRLANTSDVDSSASSSPASSVSVLTPENVQRELRPDGAEHFEQAGETRDSSNALGLFDGLPSNTPSKELGGRLIDGLPRDLHGRGYSMSAMSTSQSLPSIARSTSVHSLQGSTVIVPSVRDKIALLESRKQALLDFTSTSYSPSNTGSNNAALTPTKFGRASNNTTPTHMQAAATSINNTTAAITLNRQLQRNNSILSTASSQAEYLRHTPSFPEFKAPLLNTN